MGELRTATGAQMAVVLLDTTEGEPLEELSHRLAVTWRGGRAGKKTTDCCWVMAIADHKSRLEVGYGLEATIPDTLARQLLDDMWPALRAGNYEAALIQFIAEIAKRLGAPPSPAAPPDSGVQSVSAPAVDPPAEPERPFRVVDAFHGPIALIPFHLIAFFGLMFGIMFSMALSWSYKLFGPELWALGLGGIVISFWDDGDPDTFRFVTIAVFTLWTSIHAILPL